MLKKPQKRYTENRNKARFGIREKTLTKKKELRLEKSWIEGIRRGNHLTESSSFFYSADSLLFLMVAEAKQKQNGLTNLQMEKKVKKLKAKKKNPQIKSKDENKNKGVIITNFNYGWDGSFNQTLFSLFVHPAFAFIK